MSLNFAKNAILTLSDEVILSEYKENDDAFAVIFSRYSRIVFLKVRSYNPQSSEFDDLLQEGYIGLYKAFENFNADMGFKFSTYANTCILNNINSAIKKNSFENLSIFQNDIDEKNNITPEKILIEKENVQEVVTNIHKLLSKKEWTVFRFYLMGYSYQQISTQLIISSKSVSNAMQRIRKKLHSIFKDYM